MFQFKINHDIVCTRDKLFKPKMSESERHLKFMSNQYAHVTAYGHWLSFCPVLLEIYLRMVADQCNTN